MDFPAMFDFPNGNWWAKYFVLSDLWQPFPWSLGTRVPDALGRAGCAMSLSSCCVVQSQNEASATDADTAAEFLSKFQSKHAEVAKLVAEERLKWWLGSRGSCMGSYVHVIDRYW